MNGVMKTAICEEFYIELLFILQLFVLLKQFYITFLSYFISLYHLCRTLKCPLTYLFLFVYCFYAFVSFYKRVVQNNKGWVNEIFMKISKRKSQFWMTYCLDLIVTGHQKVFTILKEMMWKSKQKQRQRKVLFRSICKLNWIGSS